MQEVLLYTDGACSGNPGPGGWAGCARRRASAGSQWRRRHDHQPADGAEAAAEGLEALTEPANVRLISDSKYVVQGLNEWMDGWIRNGCATLPESLWPIKTCGNACKRNANASTPAEWTRGHAGNAHNERCDQLAVAAIEQLRARGETY